MSSEDDEAYVLRATAHRMSQGIEVKTHKRTLRSFRNTFLGTDAVEWLIADPKSGVEDLDGAIQVGQRLIEHGYITRVSRELKARKVRHFGLAERAKSEFRGGDSWYKFDTLRISPFQLHVVVRRARGLKSMDLNGLNDPYVKLRLGTQTAETRVVLKTNDPVWNQHFVFGVQNVDAQQLQLEVCDYDKFKQDDRIGSCQVGLSHLPCLEAASVLGEVEGQPAHNNGGGGDGEGCVCGSENCAYGSGGGGRTPWAGSGSEVDSVVSSSSAGVVEVMSESGSGGGGSGGGRRQRWPRQPHHCDAASADWDGSRSASGSTSKPRVSFASVREVAMSWVKERGSPHSTKSRSAPVLIRRGGGEGARRSKGEGGEDEQEHGYRRTSSGTGSESPQHGPRAGEEGGHADGDVDEAGLTYYRLLANNEKRVLKGDARAASQADFATSPCGEIACDIRLTSFQPKPLPVQGEAKFTLRCRIWDMYGVTSSEERNIMEINGAVVRHKVVLMLCGDRVSSASFERSKDKEKKTSFDGSVMSLDARANMATDMLKVVVQQRVSPPEIAFKPVATVSIPLRGIPVVFPEDSDTVAAAAAAAAAGSRNKKQLLAGDDDAGRDHSDDDYHEDDVHGRDGDGDDGNNGGRQPSRTRGLWSGPGGANENRGPSLCCMGAKGQHAKGGGRAPHSGDSFPEEVGAGGAAEEAGSGRHHPTPTARRYRMHTLAGPLTNRTMDNGFVVMSLTLVASGNDLLGEPDELDSENVKVPPPPPPEPLTNSILDVKLDCGYQRLRKALLWNDSKLQAAHFDLMNNSELQQSPWVDPDDEPAAQDNLTGCRRERSFMIPKSAIVASTRAESRDVVLADGPSRMVYETRSRTPAVAFGDKFLVAMQYVLTNEGPQMCRLQTSSATVFNDKVNGFVQNQIISAVSRVSKENHNLLLGLIEDALSGKAAGGKEGRRTGARGSTSLVWWGALGSLLLLLLLLLAAAPFLHSSSHVGRGAAMEDAIEDLVEPSQA